MAIFALWQIHQRPGAATSVFRTISSTRESPTTICQLRSILEAPAEWKNRSSYYFKRDLIRFFVKSQFPPFQDRRRAIRFDSSSISVTNSTNGHLWSLARKTPLSSPFWLLSNPALFSSSVPNCSWESRSWRIFQALEIWYSGDLLLRRFWASTSTRCFTRYSYSEDVPFSTTVFGRFGLHSVLHGDSNRTTLRVFYTPICTKFLK